MSTKPPDKSLRWLERLSKISACRRHDLIVDPSAKRGFTELARSSASRKVIALGLSQTPRARISPKSKSKVTMTLPSARARSTSSRSGVRFEPETADVNRLVAKLRQGIDRLRRDSSVGQKPRASWANEPPRVVGEQLL